jgi:hypothetical protein
MRSTEARRQTPNAKRAGSISGNRVQLATEQLQVQAPVRDNRHIRAASAVRPVQQQLLLQRCVLGLSLFQDGDAGIGICPEGEEIFVGSERTYAGGVGIRSLRCSRLQRIPARHSQMCQRARPAISDDSAVVDNFLESPAAAGPWPTAR